MRAEAFLLAPEKLSSDVCLLETNFPLPQEYLPLESGLSSSPEVNLMSLYSQSILLFLLLLGKNLIILMFHIKIIN